MRNLSNWVASLALLVLAGCVAPSTTIQGPMTARPAEREALAPHNGAIFQLGKNEHPLFEDRHARNVGDVLTINIVETTSASEKSSSNAQHSGTITANAGQVPYGSSFIRPFLGVNGSSNGTLANKSDSAGNNTFSGTLTVTVIEVLPNGNLMVGGEKQVAIGQSNEHIRFSGVVSPVTITGSNTVQSTQVADAHIEYKGATHVDQSAVMSMLARVFLSVLPF